KLPITLSFRYALFNTTYNTRIYAYENDILYAFSIPAYFYQGTRFYANIKYSLAKKVDFWLRWSQFYYPNLETISSGLNEIKGNTKSEIKAQLRIRF
ncbi:MAG: helix-hairpin-helix domain-containing protein, partial [Bacteroidales bacterium]|nr:helix-hairpin-helix domain-containing protein [Bacteroidales bacterium]